MLGADQEHNCSVDLTGFSIQSKVRVYLTPQIRKEFHTGASTIDRFAC